MEPGTAAAESAHVDVVSFGLSCNLVHKPGAKTWLGPFPWFLEVDMVLVLREVCLQ